ncbi:hypothetical protein [Mesonia maritima]|uniref:Uncharacterized protein n=1 Tax=Mesonia maritima TaxID=1793873 RepID=A0ABU1K5P6_9FLAO|nr:hypothetical protein [Mesonia maritima]MDR6300934.1 hypothetical protein [Mesonia maritima]
MKKVKKIEIIILGILWTISITTYSIALLNNYALFNSDYLGLVGLIIVTVIAFIRPQKLFISIFILLIFGLFNLLSFAYFFNIVLVFGFSVLITPGIQFNSLILLTILVIKKRNKLEQLYQDTFRETMEEKEETKLKTKNKFKMKFNELNDKEIENKLQQDLVPEAISALNEIKENRKK